MRVDRRRCLRRRGPSRIPWSRVLGAMLLWTAVPGAPAPAAGQEPDLPPPFTPPLAGTWTPPPSIGQPPLWRYSVGLGYGLDRTQAPDGAGGLATVGVHRSLTHPVHGALSARAQGYMGQRGSRFEGGATLHLESPALFLLAGIDWNARSRRTDASLGTSFPTIRGGLFGRGGEIRIEYLPTRAHSFNVSAVLPVGEPLAGRTRPRQVDVELPRPTGWPEPSTDLPGPVEVVADSLRESMRWLVSLSTFFWLTDEPSLGYDASVREWREVLHDFRDRLEARDRAGDAANTHERTVLRYHEQLDRAFGLALGATADAAVRRGRALGDMARLTALDEVLLPYNRTIGQYKQPDRLEGLAGRARARWLAWVDLESGIEPSRHDAALAVLDLWLGELEAVRAEIDRRTRDSRMHWLPLGLVLRPHEHRTRGQIDALIARALGRDLEGGNAVLSINGPQFQLELQRTLLEARDYHVLWIHDYAGEDPGGEPDRTAFRITVDGYLRALLDAVRAYDRTARMPVFIILLDQYHYEHTGGRRWMTLLENPLTHRVRLPRGHEGMEEEIRALQDSLRTAVASSARLQAEVRSFGSGWIERTVKVHVNITNPSDFSFRSRRLLSLPMGADNLMRDHRKVVIRDVDALDPARGEVILAGVGVGDHYATSTWDDRGLILEGPAAAGAVTELRAVLRRHGIPQESLPAPLRDRGRAPDHGRRVEALEASGATATVLQIHNTTGWGSKDATFVQMALYDLAPPGTVLYVPDSLWTGAQWMAQLVAAALRGCHVYAVAPALENAPSAGFPQMSVMQEIVTRLVVVDEVLGDRIRAEGGDLRAGLYSRRSSLDDLGSLVAELQATVAATPFLQELFPLSEGAWETLRSAAGPAPLPAIDPGPWAPVSDRAERVPQLHRKAQWVVDRETVRALSASEGIETVLAEALTTFTEGMVHPPESGPLVRQDRTAAIRMLLDVYDEARAGGQPVLYYTTGSMNLNVRSMALDGEAVAMVAGPWALAPFLDFLLLSGGVAWVSRVEEVEALLPPRSPARRLIARWLHDLL